MDSLIPKADNLEFNRNLIDYSGLELAFIGDAVWELEVRKDFLARGYKIQKLNLEVKKYVNAKSQSKFFDKIYEGLNDFEKQMAKRAKNSNIKTFPKSCTVIEYRKATAFEAIIAILYINKEYDRIKKILSCVKEL